MIRTNIKAVKEQLAVLVDKVSGQDRIDAAVALNCHPETVNRYLRGEVSKEAFGLELLGFLKNRIAEREKALA